ncbi:membrane protein insertase YidC [Pseudarthrobacter sp. SL88]|uniref:membrane protein insertase YidC n=1 Tax=Micrococcaceae TaxID=1268 RepID=UPI000701CF83|nr:MULTISPECIES: membrane protein insertase YidC [Micrococcaceae]KQQ83113.1 preprotein translocase YidC [Arthrobacter sp. Leaf137]MCT9626496.1 membrane protein insertase YidC [Pseudarthrobacter equi]MCY1676627.1 membrane protein insertase YidC [Pseudarthrobacter sp. SL88]MDQ1053978.1 YidC/Oxa1 family membrane protein insertase [Arthrobacter sp. SORGH_AS_0212]
MDFFGTIMAPFKWLVSIIMIGFHDGLSTIGMPAANGWTWTLSIIGLVLVIRAALIPVFVKQIKAQRGMQLLQPDLKKLQDKYKGKTDQLSRQAMAQEQMAMYKKHGTNPFSACLPMLIQMPFFFALFQVLSGISGAKEQGEGIGAMSHEQVVEFDASSIFGAPLSAALLHGGATNVAVVVLSIVMILAMTASQFITQKQIMAKNMSEEAMASPFMRQQKMMLYILPIVFGVGGINFPIGVLIYWTTTNLWTMGQQFFVIRRMPTPGSPAAKALAERRAAKGLPALSILTGKKDDSAEAEAEAAIAEAKGQRVQPQRKNRKKK